MIKKLLFKKLLLGTAIFSFGLGLAVAGMYNKPKAKANIVQTAQQAGSFNTLLTAVKEAGLEDTFANKCCFTVFAPTDEAFAKVPKENLEALLKVLLYHVVQGKVYSSDLR
ncbi:MAG: fasciclin domain-containing protein, partial [Aquificaceae bacterium]